MFIAKNNDLIILAKDTREGLLQALKFMVYDTIEETEIEYQLYGGEYLTSEEVAVKEKQAKITEINVKIKELESESVYDVLNGNLENVQVYKDVIKGLEETRNNL